MDRSTKGGNSLPTWHRVGGETIVPAGASVAATLPNGTEIFHIAAEGGSVYYNPGGIASTLSPGFVPANGRVIEGPLRALAALAIFGAVGVTVHIQYYQENRGK